MKIVYDIDLMRPGCVLLQATLGGDDVAMHFDVQDWLLSPTPGMKLYEITEEQLGQLVEKTRCRQK